MMIVQMDKMSAPSSRELAHRLYDKNVELENRRRKSAQARVPSDPNAWQQMRENYEAIILEDHAFSEQHNIEYALWQLHYRRIEEFRAHLSAALTSAGSTTSQGGKVPTRPDRITKIRLQFKTFLSEATGFYHDLILKIRAKYGLPLGYFSEDSGNQIVTEKDGKRSAETKKGLISCHRCLIYLGDLARYKGLYGEGDSKSRDYAAASSYYLQAAYLWPSSGNPHHQLAILATYSGDEFVAVYRYFRSLAVENPFLTARDNLIVAFEKNRQNYSQFHGDAKASVMKGSSGRLNAKGRGKAVAKLRHKDANIDSRLLGERAKSNDEIYKVFCIRFVRLNGILFTRTSLETFEELLSLVSSALGELLSSGPEEELNFGSESAECGLTIVRLISILIFTVHNVNKEAEGQTYADIVQRTVLLQKALAAVFVLLGKILKRCVQLCDPSSSCLLPGILVFMEWLACCPDVAVGGDIDDKQATLRSVFWNDCLSFLNKLLLNGSGSLDDEDENCFFNMTRYEEGETENRLALWEDFELRGFMPLQPAQSILDFSRKHSSEGEGKKEKNVRVKRILAAGKALANVVKVDQKTLAFDLKSKKFVIGVEPQTSDDCMLTSFSGSPESVSRIQEIPIDTMMNSGAVQPKVLLYMEGEDEDEEIVFKPTVTEKRNDVIASKMTHYKGLEPGQDAFAGDSQFFGGPLLTSHSSTCHQAAFSSNPEPSFCSAPVANIVPQQPMYPHSSMWLLDQQASLVNELKDFTISENGYSVKPGIQEDLGISQAHSYSLPTNQSVNVYANDASCVQGKASETGIQSNTDFIASGFDSGSFAAKTSSALPANFRNSAVTRPVRHLGPPPGFNHVPPKQVGESFSVKDLTGQNPLMDDYSWLDGYELSSSMKGLGLNQSIHQPSRSNSQFITEGNDTGGTVSFPFPGKLVPTAHFAVGKQQVWQDHKPLEHLNLRHDQLQEQHIMNGSQQFIPPEKYQGQSIWAGRYFV